MRTEVRAASITDPNHARAVCRSADCLRIIVVDADAVHAACAGSTHEGERMVL